MDAPHSGKLVEAANALEDGKSAIAIRMKHIVLADLHGWDFVTGTDDIFGIREEPGDTNFLLELRDLKNAEVTESSPVQSVQGRINARKNW